MNRARARALMVGMGGLGCPAALGLVRAGLGTVGLCDDDLVERSNLHRQILFQDDDVGSLKLDAARRALLAAAPGASLRLHHGRLVPDNAVALVSDYDVVLEGSDNFATKFLTADACAFAGVPVVHASAVRWIGTVLAVAAGGRPCYRCLFEDLPSGEAPNCAEAGVMGPVLGILAAAQVDLALALIDGQRLVAGELLVFDGLKDRLRRRTIAARRDCALCGQKRGIWHIDPERYIAPACAG